MRGNTDLVYFVNSQGKTTYLVSPENTNYWEMSGRYGFSAPDIDVFKQTFASGATKYYGKAFKPRTCGLKMICVGKDMAERDRIFYDMLDTLLDADGDGEGKLYCKRADGTMVFLNCIYISGMNVAEQYKTIKQFTVEFFAADPWFYTSNKYYFPSKVGVMEINNYSDKVVYPVLHLYQPCNFWDWGEGPHSILNNTITHEVVEFYNCNEQGTPTHQKWYYTVEMCSEPQNPYIIEKSYIVGSAFHATPELVVGGINNFAFSLNPGNNLIDYYFSSLRQMDSYIDVLVKYAGV